MELTQKQLRNFGIGLTCSLTLFFGLFLPWFFERSYSQIPFALAGVTLALALSYPSLLKYPYKFLHGLAKLIEFLLIRFILLLLFYFILFPFSFVLRRGIRRRMGYGFDASLASYRTGPSCSSERASYERLF